MSALPEFLKSGLVGSCRRDNCDCFKIIPSRSSSGLEKISFGKFHGRLAFT